jgi:hypothetical protein
MRKIHTLQNILISASTLLTKTILFFFGLFSSYWHIRRNCSCAYLTQMEVNDCSALRSSWQHPIRKSDATGGQQSRSEHEKRPVCAENRIRTELKWRGSISGNDVRIFLSITFSNACCYSTWPLSLSLHTHTWCFAASAGYFRGRHSVWRILQQHDRREVKVSVR